MQTRSVHLTVLTLLLATPLAAAFLLWTIDRRSADAAAHDAAIAAAVERARDAIAEIAAAQQSYVAPGQLDEPWFEQTATLLDELTRELAAIQPRLRTADAAAAMQTLTESLEALKAADARTRQNLSLGQELMAADVIFSDGRNILEAMVTGLRELRDAERAAPGAGLVARTRWAVFGVLALLWLGAAAGLTRIVRLAAPIVTAVEVSTPPPVEAPAARPAVDLAATAALCSDLSRVTDTPALAAVLGRAASILDAPGVMLWMSAGDQLFAVLGHGYTREHLARFAPIGRDAGNAAAAAWRTGRLSVVAGDGAAAGGLVAPLFGPAGCIGVLALECRQGREGDPGVQAVATMVAAQLATAVAAWPAASTAPTAAPAEARSA